MNDRLSKLRDALGALGDEYTEAVMKLGRERNTEHPGEFRVVDFLAGASAVYLLLAEDDNLTGPPAAWFMSLALGRNPLYPKGDVPLNDPRLAPSFLSVVAFAAPQEPTP